MANKSEIYFLSYYANKKNLEHLRETYKETYKVKYSKKEGHSIELSETNSFNEDKFSLNFISSSFVVEGFFDKQSQTDIKEAMIHHHPHSHPWKHLQFTLGTKEKRIRIKIDGIDQEDYLRCIRGFLYTTQNILESEQQKLNITDDLIDFFFNEQIQELASDRYFLLEKIKFSYESNNILNDDGKSLSDKEIDIIKKENRLLPFFEWD